MTKLITTTNSWGNFYKKKLNIAFYWTIFLVVLFQLVDFLFLVNRIGIEALKYPLSSLTFFSTTPYSLTIGEGFLIASLLRIIGGLGLTSLLVIFCNFSKTKSSIYYILLTFVFLGKILVFKKEVFYYLPGFYSLFRAWGIWQEIYI